MAQIVRETNAQPAKADAQYHFTAPQRPDGEAGAERNAGGNQYAMKGDHWTVTPPPCRAPSASTAPAGKGWRQRRGARRAPVSRPRGARCPRPRTPGPTRGRRRSTRRSEEHTSELQSRLHLVCRLLLEKKKKKTKTSSKQHDRLTRA